MRNVFQPCIYILASHRGGTMELAIAREKQLKRWHRQWKINLLEEDNPEWRDLAFDIGAGPIGRTMDAETSSA